MGLEGGKGIVGGFSFAEGTCERNFVEHRLRLIFIIYLLEWVWSWLKSRGKSDEGAYGSMDKDDERKPMVVI